MAIDQDTFTILGGKISMHRQNMMPSEDGIWLAACLGNRLAEARVFDAFSGSGVVGLCALHHGAEAVCAVEQDADLSALGVKNAALNGFSGRWRGVVGDVSDVTISGGNMYDVVLGNPPFYGEAAGFSTEKSERARAHGLAAGALSSWVGHLWQRVTSGGVLGLILHVREVGIIEDFAAAQEISVRRIFLQTSEQRPAKRVVVLLGEAGADRTVEAWRAEVRERVLQRGEKIKI